MRFQMCFPHVNTCVWNVEFLKKQTKIRTWLLRLAGKGESRDKTLWVDIFICLQMEKSLFQVKQLVHFKTKTPCGGNGCPSPAVISGPSTRLHVVLVVDTSSPLALPSPNICPWPITCVFAFVIVYFDKCKFLPQFSEPFFLVLRTL